MVIRLIILILLVSACRSGEMACPDPQFVKLRRKPANYMRKTLSASNRETEKEKREGFIRPQPNRNVKTIDSIEEWDCPRPGSKAIPKSVKENIRKNRKRFEIYYKNRAFMDSVQTTRNRP